MHIPRTASLVKGNRNMQFYHNLVAELSRSQQFSARSSKQPIEFGTAVVSVFWPRWDPWPYSRPSRSDASLSTDERFRLLRCACRFSSTHTQLHSLREQLMRHYCSHSPIHAWSNAIGPPPPCKRNTVGEGGGFFGAECRARIVCNPILFAICTSTISRFCKTLMLQHAQECTVALPCN
jgi:hypothetical protein